MKFTTITQSIFFKAAVRALIGSIGLQIIVLFFGARNIGGLTGFRYLVNLIYTLLLVPYMLADVTLGNSTRLSGNAIETISWAAQFGLYFIIFYSLFLARGRGKKKADDNASKIP